MSALWERPSYINQLTQVESERRNMPTRKKKLNRKNLPIKFYVYDAGCQMIRGPYRQNDEKGFTTKAAALAFVKKEEDCCDGPLFILEKVAQIKKVCTTEMVDL